MSSGRPNKVKISKTDDPHQHTLPQLNTARQKPQWALTNPPFALLKQPLDPLKKSIPTPPPLPKSGPKKFVHQDTREKFRKMLVDVIFGSKNRDSNSDTPVIGQAELTKYRYFIKNGVDTENVAQLENKWLSNMFDLVEDKFKYNLNVVESLSDEVREDYLLSVKKAIVDFTLKLKEESNHQLDQLQTFEAGSANDSPPSPNEIIFARLKKEQTAELAVVPKPWRNNFLECRNFISKRLFTINPTVSQVMALWHREFTDLRLVDVTELLSRNEALEGQMFHRIMMSHTEQAKEKLLKKWFYEVTNIFYQENKQKHYPSNRFFIFIPLISMNNAY